MASTSSSRPPMQVHSNSNGTGGVATRSASSSSNGSSNSGSGSGTIGRRDPETENKILDPPRRNSNSSTTAASAVHPAVLNSSSSSIQSPDDEDDNGNDDQKKRLMIGRFHPVKVIGYMPDIPPLLQTPEPFAPLTSKQLAKAKRPERGDRDSVPSTPFMDFFFPKSEEEKRSWTSFLREGSMRGSIFNLCSATLGAGALSLPYSFAQSGIVLAIIMLLVGAWATIFSIELLLTCRRVTGKTSYEDITVFLFGRRMGYVVEMNIIVFCFGIMVAYIVAVGDILTPLLSMDFLPAWIDRRLLMIMFWAAIMFPLSLLNKMNSLRFSSFFGVMAIFYLVFSTVYHSASTAARHHTPKLRLFEFGLGVFKTMPVVMFAFTCQVNVFQIQSELERPTKRRMLKVARRAIGLCLVVYTMMGVAGYADFGADTNADILNNYDVAHHPNGVVLTAFGAITLTVVMAFPLNVFPCRYTIAFMLWGHGQSSSSSSSSDDVKALPPPSQYQRPVVHSDDDYDILEADEDDDGDYYYDRTTTMTTVAGVAVGDLEKNSAPSASFNTPPVRQQKPKRAASDHRLLNNGRGKRGHSSRALSSTSAMNGTGDDEESLDAPLLLAQQQQQHESRGEHAADPDSLEMSRLSHFFLTFAICGSALGVALYVPHINVVFQLMGGTSSAFVCFILPAAFVIKLECWTSQAEKVAVWGLLIGGIVAGVLSTAVTLMDIFK